MADLKDPKTDSVEISFSNEGGTFIEAEEVDEEEYSGPYPGKVFNVFYSGCATPDVSSDVGTVKRLQTGIPIKRTETFEFVGEKEADLTYKPTGPVTREYSTVGKDYSISGKKIRFSKEKTGLLKVSYQTTCERWGFNFTPAEQQCDDGKPPAALIIFKCGPELTSEKVENWYCNQKDVSIKVTDACTGDPVPNASVFVDGQKKGITDSVGDITIKDLTEGEHSVKITADGYIDSGADPLDNDTINVSYNAEEDE